jgi:hypothetical protein
MTLQDKIFETAVVPEDQPVVNVFRRSIRDDANLNRLEKVQESEDLDLYYALLTAASEIRTEVNGIIEINSLRDIPWNILQQGALLKLLTTLGILSARNMLTYQDAGGVTVQDYDRYGRYINYFNVLINGYWRSVMSWKTQENINNCFGGVPSEYSLGTRRNAGYGF